MGFCGADVCTLNQATFNTQPRSQATGSNALARPCWSPFEFYTGFFLFLFFTAAAEGAAKRPDEGVIDKDAIKKLPLLISDNPFKQPSLSGTDCGALRHQCAR